jgi:sugar phosphate isomerase/epimerase
MIEIGYHTDAWNASFYSFKKAVDWAGEHGVTRIECGAVDGVTWLHGLGYHPHIALWEDPIALKAYMAERGVRFSQIDAAFPLTLREGLSLGVQYIKNTIRWAKMVECRFIDTTDYMEKPADLTDEQVMDQLKRAYEDVLPVAESHNTIINIEPHGYFTTNIEKMHTLLNYFDTPWLRLNMDTGNTFIAGQDPVEFLDALKDFVSHVHIKDVSEELAASLRGEATGIALSHCAVGDGVNADNIRKCLQMLADQGYQGILSIESEGTGGMLEKGVEWLRKEVAEIFPE